ncbi:MAG: hypothetical protein ACLRVU_01065 [Beduini sp.]|uniref:hypothetical protein n=1 Tax=Beduini sp. TaxID=1922300 RepID=UPI0039A23182
MNKNELVVEIMNLCDENERLKNELQIIKNDYLLNQKVIEKQPSRMIYEIIKFGESRMLTECIYIYRKENYEIVDMSYEDWLDENLCRNNIPKSISRAEFEEYFNDQLHEMYEKEKDAAIREAKGIENVEDE